MCGIVYIQNLASGNVHKSVFKRYSKQKTRGSDGFGFVGFNLATGRLKHFGRSSTEKEIKEVLEETKANAVLFHHRYPTSTPNLPEANHPILVHNERLDFDYYVVHKIGRAS